MINLTQAIIIVLFVIMMVAFIIAFIIIYHKRHARYLLEKQLLHAAHQQELLHDRLEIQEQTLQHVAQEIHDNIGQVLSLAKLNLGTLKHIHEPKYADTCHLVAKAITDLRSLSRSLHGSKIADMGLASALESELQLLQNSGRFTTRFSVTGQAVPLSAHTETMLFRIVQEAISNAIKHSGGNRVEVDLSYQPGRLQMLVADNGVGFNAAGVNPQQAGIGLRSMYNRASMAGADLQLQSQPGAGTKLLLNLPVD